ncbi:MAG TPA: hypothetical protein VGM91_06565 [Conexibacter sp.]|jgi:hypothetical protein
MAPQADAPGTPDEESIVLASFESRQAAERMLGSLGGAFRRKAREGSATAFVVSANKDGSLKVTQSRVLSAGDLSAAVIRVAASVGIGFSGIFSALRGVERGAHDARKRQGHVGSDEQRAHEILAKAGPHAALALVRCQDDKMRHEVVARASDRAAGDTWDGLLADFLSSLDPSDKHDWVRTALDEPPPTQ